MPITPNNLMKTIEWRAFDKYDLQLTGPRYLILDGRTVNRKCKEISQCEIIVEVLQHLNNNYYATAKQKQQTKAIQGLLQLKENKQYAELGQKLINYGKDRFTRKTFAAKNYKNKYDKQAQWLDDYFSEFSITFNKKNNYGIFAPFSVKKFMTKAGEITTYKENKNKSGTQSKKIRNVSILTDGTPGESRSTMAAIKASFATRGRNPDGKLKRGVPMNKLSIKTPQTEPPPESNNQTKDTRKTRSNPRFLPPRSPITLDYVTLKF